MNFKMLYIDGAWTPGASGAYIDVENPVNKKIFASFDKFEEEAVKLAVKSGYAKSGEHIIITAGFPLGKKGRTNMLHTVYIP